MTRPLHTTLFRARKQLSTYLLLCLSLLTACDSGAATVTPVPAPSPTQAAATGTAAATVTSPPTATPILPPSPTSSQSGATATAAPAGEGEFQNPVLKADFPDPFVLKDGDTYFAYATNGSGKNIQEASSTDLVHWKVLADAMPALPTWAQLGGSYVWAPEVIKIGDKYVMYYTARDKTSNKQCVGVATSDKADGKFRDANTAPFVCQASEGGTIDPSPYRDGEKLYLYFKNDGNCCNKTTFLYAQELAPDGLSLLGEPVQLAKNDHAWEGGVVEAPTMWKHDGKYFLFYSANGYAGFDYAVGYANCTAPLGPCEDAPENPILASRRQVPLVIGPGHQAIITTADGQDWILYHVWEVTSAGMRGSRRFLWVDRLDWQNDKPIVEGPTLDPQPLP